MKVTKRNGAKVDFDIGKIKKSIAFACNKTNSNPLELESVVNQFMKEGITTETIQKNIIQQAVQLASVTCRATRHQAIQTTLLHK